MSFVVDLAANPTVTVALAAPPRPTVAVAQPGLAAVSLIGTPGPPGPPGGPTVIAVPYDQWPPTNEQPDTLYLRLAP